MPHVFVLVVGVPLTAILAMTRINVRRTREPIIMCNLNLILAQFSIEKFILQCVIVVRGITKCSVCEGIDNR